MPARPHRWVALLLVVVAPALARADAADDFIAAEMQRQHVPGLTLAVLQDGRPLKLRAYGVANVELQVPATVETVYKIASVSKQFVAAGVMLLVQDGKLELDAPISRYLDGGPDGWKAITIRHLLTHTSGLPRELPGWSPLKEYTDADIVAAAAAARPEAPPGERYQYCNVGYFLLGVIIHKTSGKSWDKFLHERLFAPLGMTATRATTLTELVPHRATGYEWRGELRNAPPLLSVRTSGGLLSSVPDLMRWEAALLSPDGPLTSASKAQMWAPTALANGRKYPYGLGWGVADVRGLPAISHGGSLAGFRSYYLRIPAGKYAVIVLANGGAAVDTIARAAAAQYVPELNFAVMKPWPDAGPETGPRLRALLEAHAAGAATLPGATDELRDELAKATPAARAQVAARMKALTAFDVLARREVRDLGIERHGVPVVAVVHCRLSADGRTDYGTFYLAADGRIAGLEVGPR